MRKILIALSSLMLVGTFAFAQSAGECDHQAANQLSQDGWNQSSLSVCVEGDIVSAVEFSVTNAIIELDTGALAPGSAYTIRFVVTNDSDREITVSDNLQNSQALGNFAAYFSSPSNGVNVPVGATRNYDIVVDFPEDDPDHDLASEINSGQPGSFEYGDTIHAAFDLVAVGEDPNVTATQQ